MKIVSWNVAGINACVKKGLREFMTKEHADIYCFQEVKASKNKLPKELENLSGYASYHAYSERNGYSGVSVYTRIPPLAVIELTGEEVFDKEGRVLTLEFAEFILVNVYFPHSTRTLQRLAYKLLFNTKFEEFCKKQRAIKPLIIASDFNVAHTEIDLKNARQNIKNAGFTREEREWFDSFLKNGFIDTFREFVKDGGNYTWWTYRNNARNRNIGITLSLAKNYDLDLKKAKY